MTPKDLELLELARNAARTDYDFIDSLWHKAESEEAKRELDRMSHDAFVAEEIAGDFSYP